MLSISNTRHATTQSHEILAFAVVHGVYSCVYVCLFTLCRAVVVFAVPWCVKHGIASICVHSHRPILVFATPLAFRFSSCSCSRATAKTCTTPMCVHNLGFCMVVTTSNTGLRFLLCLSVFVFLCVVAHLCCVCRYFELIDTMHKLFLTSLLAFIPSVCFSLLSVVCYCVVCVLSHACV